MPMSLRGEVVDAIETRVQKIKSDYENRLAKDRKQQTTILSCLSWGVGIAFTVLAYFGVKGFDDLIDRAIEKKYPRAEWESMMQEVRDHALVHSLVIQGMRPDGTAANTVETDAFQRLLTSQKTRDGTFGDVVAVLKRMPSQSIPPSVFDAMATFVRADAKDKMEWVKKHPNRQEQLVSFLADHRYALAAESVTPLLKSSSNRELQLAAIRYVRECQVHAAIPELSRIMGQQTTRGDVQSAAAITLISLQPNHDVAKKWLTGLVTKIGTMEGASSTLVQVGVITETLLARERSRAPSGVTRTAMQGTRDGPDLAERAVADILRSVLKANYILTLARRYEGDRRHLVYLAQDVNKFSEEDISTSIFSARYVDLLLKQELTAANGNLDMFKKLVRGLSGIVTERNVGDIGQEVILYLGSGQIELADGLKLSQQAVERGAIDQKIEAGWILRNVKLSINANGELMAENGSRSGAGGLRRGKVRSIHVGNDSVFSIRPAEDNAPASELPERQATAPR